MLNIAVLTGTSGGAKCALFAWDGLLTVGNDKVIELLDRFWNKLSTDLSADLMI